MPKLTASFSIVDKMSQSIEQISQAGNSMADRFERAGAVASSAFDGMERGAATTASSVDGIATSISDLQEAANDAASSSDTLADAMNGYGDAANSAAEQTDHWTEAAENYSKSALEAVYSTEELVELGLKSADALEEQENMMRLCERSAESLNRAMEASNTIQSRLSSAIDETGQAMKKLSNNESVSADTKEELSRAAERAREAMDALAKAQDEADSAMMVYNQTMTSGTTDLNRLEAAAEQVCHVAEALAEANGQATDTTDELSRAIAQAADEAKNSEQNGVSAIEGIEGTLAAAEITAKVTEIAGAVYDMADSFSEAEKTIIARTGATGEELEKLKESARDVFASSSAENVNDVAVSMTAVQTATGLAGEALEEATNMALTLENALGLEVNETTRTAGALMKNFGIEAEAAYNIIAAGAQQGANQNGDLLDVLNEYSAQYAAIGLSADEFISSLVDGADAGVFSVDKVGDAVKEFNIRVKDSSDTTAEAFKLIGMNADTMASRFAAGGETARTAFFEVVNALNSMADPVEKNMAAVNLFGTMYEDLGESILPVLAGIEGGSVDTSNALSSMAEEAQSLGDQWQQAGNSISTAFTSAVEPAVSGVSDALAEATKGFGEFLSEHPAVTKLITATAAGFGAVTVGLTGFVFATKVAIPAVTAFGTALNTALGPIGWAALAITGIITAATTFSALMSDTEEVIEDYDGTLSECADEIEHTAAAYEKACNLYGENSKAAKELSEELDTLNKQYEKGGGYLGDLRQQSDLAAEGLGELKQAVEEQQTAAEGMETSGLKSVAMLDALADKSELTNKDLDLMSQYADYLNDTFNCNIAVDYETGELTGFDPASVVTQIQEAAEQAKIDAAESALSNPDLLDNYTIQFETLSGAQEELEELQGKFGDTGTAAYEFYKQLEAEGSVANFSATMQTAYDDIDTLYDYAKKLGLEWGNAETEGSFWKFISEMDNAKNTAEKLRTEFEATDDMVKEYCDTIDESGQLYETFTEAMQNSSNTMAEVAENSDGAMDAAQEGAAAAAAAYEGVRAEVEALCVAYNEAYAAALESFEGQFGLFDEASTTSEEYLNATVGNAQAALDSQLAYWEQYNANLDTLTAYGEGLTGEARENYEALLEYASSGSEEAAGLAASMAEAINSGNEEAINELAETVGQVSEQQEQAAATTADFLTDFSGQMDELEKKMADTVTHMNLSDEAQASATATISNYAAAIRTGQRDAVAAAQSVADAVSKTLASAKATINVKVNSSGSVPGHAKGTTNAESVFVAGERGPELVARRAAAYATGTTDSTDYFIAGENGPELIVGEQGSTVFPTSETDRLINALNEKERPLRVMPAAGSRDAKREADAPTEQVKRILLEIAGRGTIEAGPGMNKETVLEILYEHLKPVLMGMIQSEIYEEGDLSYEY